MAVKETIKQLFGEEDFFFSDGDGSGCMTKSGVWYQLNATGYKPMVVVRLDNKSDLVSAGLTERSFRSTIEYGLRQVVHDVNEPPRVSEIRMIYHKMPFLDSGISKN